MPNQVTLTFGSDTKAVEDGFDRVGGAAKRMDDTVGGATRKLDEHANGMSKVGEAADNSERNLIGVHDVIDGTATIMQGPGKQGIVAYIQGWADLAGGLAPIILSLAETRAGTIAQSIASKAAGAAARVYAAGQWIMNASVYGFPLVWIIAAIVAVIAIIVLIARKTDWFSKGWAASWAWVKRAAANTWDYLKKIPGWVSSAFARVSSAITAPFRSAFNGIARAWNNTIGRLAWSVPSWVPFIGGNSISVPNLPTFHAGGVVPGVVGSTVIAAVQAGEKITGVAGSSGDGSGWVTVRGDGLIDALTRLIADRVSARGGRPALLGVKVS